MSLEILTQLISSCLFFGIFYGVTNTRLKHIEAQIKANNDLSERLARIEEKTSLIIKYFTNEKNSR